MAVAWITIASTDLDDYLVAAQVDAYQTAAIASGQADPFVKIAADIAQRIRRKIQSSPRNLLSETANSIPPELKWIACLLILEAMGGRLGMPLTDDQREQIREAKKQLDRIADGKDVVSEPTDPDDPGDAQGPAAAEIVSSNTRKTTRATLEGL